MGVHVGRENARENFEFGVQLFANSVAGDVQRRQELAAVRAPDLLGGEVVTHSELETVVIGLGFEIGSVYDAEGRLLTGLPEKPELVGRDFTEMLEHVRIAKQGRAGVSQAVISPALGLPVVGVAVPYDTAYGRRILAGAFPIQGDTLDRLLQQFLGLEADYVAIVDRDVNLVAATHEDLPEAITPLAQLRPALAGALQAAPTADYGEDGAEWFYSSAPIGDTGWMLVASLRAPTLYADTRPTERTGWTLLTLFATGGLAAVLVIGRSSHRLRVAEAATSRLNRELEDRVARRTRDLVAANRELETFSYSISHDLRAPLRAITGFSSILLDEHREQLDDEAARLLDVVIGNADRMSALIDDVLAFSRVSRHEIAHRPIDMAQMVRRVVAELQASDPDREAKFEIGPLPAAVGDPKLIRQVWINLLTNAFKFTCTVESPEIVIDSEPCGAGVRYRVRDNGAGFDMRYADKLFEVFQRLHGDEFPGTGIGLAIVERVVTRHGGTVEAEGTPGNGAVFSFTLPHIPI